jgi:hypothetical protein
MCLFFTLLFLGPRFGLLLYWIAWPARWEIAFDGWVVPLLGFFLAPWTTLAWVLCGPGGIEGFDVALVVMAVLADLLTLAGSGGSYRRRA